MLSQLFSERVILCALCVLCGCFFCVSPVRAQTTRLAVLQAEDRRAPTAADLATIRAGVNSGDDQTVRVSVRALGRLERPSLIADITPALRHAVPEIRAEAATAIGQASQGWKRAEPPAVPVLNGVLATLVARLKVEADADVRGAICETIGRLPYSASAQVENAERALLDMAARADSVTDRLGVAKGFEALVRNHRKLRGPSEDALAVLRTFAVSGAGEPSAGARVRRLALEALIAAGAADDKLVSVASHDQDSQVRRIVMRAISVPGVGSAAADTAIADGLADDSPIVRLEALRAARTRSGASSCTAAVAASADRDVHVALVAIDQLAGCAASPDAIAALEGAVNDVSAAAAPRAWHRTAHALVSLAAAAAERGGAALARYRSSPVWQLRMYAARAATILQDRSALDHLAADDNDNVREAAVDGLKKTAGHDADEVYIAQLTRNGYQVLRAAALALDGTPNTDKAVPALEGALERLIAEGRDNSHDARDAIATTLASVGADPRVGPDGAIKGRTRTSAPTSKTLHNDLTLEELRRLASPRARITIRGVGTFELALFTAQAPSTVLRFAHLAESGYYNGLTFHRVVPNFVIQGGSPGANEYVGDAMFLRDELGSWPHVRGTVGISTRGRDTGDAQIFIDLVDNPRLDHEYTVFAQVLNGIDIVDRILEGDVIEKVEIVPQ